MYAVDHHSLTITDSMWAEGNGTTVAGGGAAPVSAPTPAPDSASGLPGTGAEISASVTTTRASQRPTLDGITTTGTGVSFGISQTSSGPAQVSTAGAQPMPLIHAGAGLAGLLGVVAYGFI